MRYYTDKGLPTNWSYVLNEKIINTINDKWILTQEGLYKCVKNQLHKFKLRLSENNPHHLSAIKSSNMEWVKYDYAYNVPIQHKIINIKTFIYKLHPKSLTTFIVEELNDNIHDYYFESSEEIDNHSLNEDINSFLSYLSNI
jgi:hypothetical protein|uniref:Uncharacterized protein n=1 Tax=viral metagenome TaxID=1070528 RepID=A0A6C0C4R6_9ZZZZ